MHTLRFALVSLVLSSAASAAVDSAALESAVERAYVHASSTDLATASAAIDAALAADPKNPALLYERGFATYAAAMISRAHTDKQATIARLETAASTLGRVRGQPWEAEAEALHSSILGQLIGLKGGMSGMTLGPKSSQLIARAARQLPGSPRVQLFRAISLLNTPAAFGGDPAEGMKLLQEVVTAFATPAATEGPRWGHGDALAWLGLARQKNGDTAGARQAWEEALALEPDFAWVKFALLPSLNQKTAR